MKNVGLNFCCEVMKVKEFNRESPLEARAEFLISIFLNLIFLGLIKKCIIIIKMWYK